MNRLTLAGALLVSITLIVSGCGTAITKLKKAETAYQRGKVAEAEKIMLPLQTETKDRDYPLVLLSLGSLHLSVGDYYSAEKTFTAALANLDVSLNEIGVAKQVLKSEESRLYRGFSHEKVLAHTYLGLCYMQQGMHNEARIEFAKAREEDKGKEAGQEDDFGASYFLDGLNAIQGEDYQHARVSFRKVIELKPDYALGWYFLSRASLLDGDAGEADEAWEEYDSLAADSERLPKDGEASYALFMLDVGWGPLRTPDPLVGQFARWKDPKNPQAKLVFKAHGADVSETQTHAVADQYYQASTAGGFGEDVGKKVVSVAAKEAIKAAVPILGLFVGKSEADTRCWSISPGTIQFAAVPVTKEPATMELNVHDKNGVHLPLYDQVLYYITGKSNDDFDLIYVRVMPNADYRETH